MACLSLSGCGTTPNRSVAAVCHVWQTQAVALHNQYARDAAGEPLLSVIDLIRAPDDLANLMDNMAAVAPTNIEPDFAALATTFHQVSASEGQAFTDPLGAALGNFVSVIAISGSYQRVNYYIWTNCSGPGTSHPD
jgi:hypothetical protein